MSKNNGSGKITQGPDGPINHVAAPRYEGKQIKARDAVEELVLLHQARKALEQIKPDIEQAMGERTEIVIEGEAGNRMVSLSVVPAQCRFQYDFADGARVLIDVQGYMRLCKLVRGAFSRMIQQFAADTGTRVVGDAMMPDYNPMPNNIKGRPGEIMEIGGLNIEGAGVGQITMIGPENTILMFSRTLDQILAKYGQQEDML